MESNPGRRRVGWRRRTQSDLVEGDAEEEAAEEGEAEGTTPTDIDRTPNQKITFFKTPPSTAGVTLFPKKDIPPVAKVVA